MRAGAKPSHLQATLRRSTADSSLLGLAAGLLSRRTRRYEYGVYADEVLQHSFPPSMAVITNIGNG